MRALIRAPRPGRRALPLLAALALCLSSGTAAGSSLEEAREEWLTEVARLERAIEQYRGIAEEQTQAFVGLEGARIAVDEGILNPEIGVDELRRLESSLTRLRDAAVRQADAAAEARERIYEALALVDRLGAQLENAASSTDSFVPDAGAAGLWSMTWEGRESGSGMVRLETKANLVFGTYRLSNGNAGTLRGTAAGDEVDLEVVHSVRGKVGHVAISLSADGSSGEGNWRAMELAGPTAATGSFQLQRVE